MDDLDSFDRAILDRLQRTVRETSEAIGEAVGLSPTAVQRRIRRLRECGAILAEVAVVAPQAAGRRLTAIVEVALAQGAREDLVDGFKRRVRARPEVQQCYYVAGDHDFVLIVTAQDMADYDRLTRSLLFEDPLVARFRTTVVIDPVKVGLGVPIA
ncbi:MAG TPA: Lrp/AsnC family transcriptional regulator [Azospirillaceae bacterium]|nr:Lrp/AsnC family transcriptional regulator [Azospirillaceae bacterium]